MLMDWLESTSWLISSATTSPVSSWLITALSLRQLTCLLHPHQSPLSPSVTPLLFRSKLKTFLFHKSFRSIDHWHLRTDFIDYWTVQRFSFHLTFFHPFQFISFLLVTFSFTAVTSITGLFLGLLPSPLISKWRRYCVARRPSVTLCMCPAY